MTGAMQAYSCTPLMCACQKGHTGIAQLLLSHEADIDAADTYRVQQLTPEYNLCIV